MVQFNDTTKICKQCDKSYERPYGISATYWQKRTFCSVQCRVQYQVPLLKGSNNPNYKGGKSVCGDCNVILPHRYEYLRKAQFYCKKCYGKHLGGVKHHMWKGGITPINNKIRTSAQMRAWRLGVFKRDGFKCTSCGYDKGKILQAHHIKPFSSYPKLRFLLDNGTTLCKPCHMQTDTYARVIKTKIW